MVAAPLIVPVLLGGLAGRPAQPAGSLSGSRRKLSFVDRDKEKCAGEFDCVFVVVISVCVNSIQSSPKMKDKLNI